MKLLKTYQDGTSFGIYKGDKIIFQSIDYYNDIMIDLEMSKSNLIDIHDAISKILNK